jgi:L-amino acid N-acyltransferase YncA
MVIREARIEDVPAVAKVHVDSWRTTYRGIVPDAYLDALAYENREQLWNGFFADPNRQGVLYVAENSERQIVGFASGGPSREKNPVYTGELYAIYLFKAAQGGGIGRQLIGVVASSLLQGGYQSILAWVLADNPSCKFYEAVGGKLTQEKLIEIGGANLREVAYGWPDIRQLINKK